MEDDAFARLIRGYDSEDLQAWVCKKDQPRTRPFPQLMCVQTVGLELFAMRQQSCHDLVVASTQFENHSIDHRLRAKDTV